MTLAVGDITSKLLDDVASVDFGEEESLYDRSMTLGSIVPLAMFDKTTHCIPLEMFIHLLQKSRGFLLKECFSSKSDLVIVSRMNPPSSLMQPSQGTVLTSC